MIKGMAITETLDFTKHEEPDKNDQKYTWASNYFVILEINTLRQPFFAPLLRL